VGETSVPTKAFVQLGLPSRSPDETNPSLALERPSSRDVRTLGGLLAEWNETDRVVTYMLPTVRTRSCKNTIDHIHRTLRRNEGDLSSDSAGTQTILESIGEVEREVRRIWGPLLQRQQRADRLKQALAALKRLHWVLPSPAQQVRASRLTLIASWETLRARWVTLRARWVTLRASWFAEGVEFVPPQPQPYLGMARL
jgi:hypothetical protein